MVHHSKLVSYLFRFVLVLVFVFFLVFGLVLKHLLNHKIRRISAEWSAFRLNGTVKFDDVYGEALANGDVYVQLRQQDGSALARGQLSRVDEVYGASLVGPMQHQVYLYSLAFFACFD